MSIGRDEAARALRDAEAAAGRSAAAAGYQRTSGYLILWGVVWAVGNVMSYAAPALAGPGWMALVAAGVAGSVVLGLRGRTAGGAARGSALASLLIALALAGFGFGISVVVPVNSFDQSEAAMCLGVGAAYMVLGSRMGLRMAGVGAAIMIATVAGWLYAREQFFLWMAVAGGGGLILGGLWMRKA